MASEANKLDGPERRPSLAYLVIIGAALLVVVALAALGIYWLAVRATTGVPSIPAGGSALPTAGPDKATTAALIVLDGAKQLSRGPGAYGSFHVAYALAEKYPASNAIQRISSRLKALGWKPLHDDWLNPGLPSSHVRGWTDFVDFTATPMRHVHQWGAQWQDKAGNIVGYDLRYSYPESGAPDFQSLWIDAFWYPAAGVKMMQAATR
jgi:hypothetical protein